MTKKRNSRTYDAYAARYARENRDWIREKTKEYQKKYQQEYYRKNRKKLNKRSAEWRKENPEKFKISQIKSYQKHNEIRKKRANDYYWRKKAERLAKGQK